MRSFSINIAFTRVSVVALVAVLSLLPATYGVFTLYNEAIAPLVSLGSARFASSSAVSAYVTTADASIRLTQGDAVPRFSSASTGKLPVVSVDDTLRYQTIDGFGVDLTGSSAYLLAHMPDHGAALLAELFRSDSGIGLSYVRVTVGASDFSLGSYTYDDVLPGHSDPTLAAFSVTRDEDVLSAMQSIHRVSSDVRFMASPWSPPAWMKTGQSIDGGTLRADAYGAYARYLVSYMRALAKRGIALDALTPQNEPLLNAAYPSMTLPATDEAAFVRTALGPAMQASFPATKLVINDHNWDGDYPLTVLRDAGAARYVTGTAFHCYAGNVSQMSDVERAFPDKATYITECSGGAWSPKFRNNLAWDMQNLIIGGTANYARTVLLGNLALDDAGGPTNGGCMNCRGVVTIHADGTYTRNVEYYVLAHAAKLVRPGAVRIASSNPLGRGLPNVAFVNVDGSKVLIVLNHLPRGTSFAVRFHNAAFRFWLPSGAVATFVW